jgi:hypothetical protein
MEPLVIAGLIVDESTQVLVFVCVPLTLLLVLLIILMRRYSHRSVRFPNYSVAISKVGQTAAYVVYRSDIGVMEFVSEVRKGKKFFKSVIYVMVPTELSEAISRKIVPNLALGLDKLHYDYFIFRKTASQPIPAAERDAAVAKLRRMGVEIQQPIASGEISRAVIKNMSNRRGGQASATISRVQALMMQAAAARDDIEVLACSDSDLRLYRDDI